MSHNNGSLVTGESVCATDSLAAIWHMLQQFNERRQCSLARTIGNHTEATGTLRSLSGAEAVIGVYHQLFSLYLDFPSGPSLGERIHHLLQGVQTVFCTHASDWEPIPDIIVSHRFVRLPRDQTFLVCSSVLFIVVAALRDSAILVQVSIEPHIDSIEVLVQTDKSGIAAPTYATDACTFRDHLSLHHISLNWQQGTAHQAGTEHWCCSLRIPQHQDEMERGDAT